MYGKPQPSSWFSPITDPVAALQIFDSYLTVHYHMQIHSQKQGFQRGSMAFYRTPRFLLEPFITIVDGGCVLEPYVAPKKTYYTQSCKRLTWLFNLALMVANLNTKLKLYCGEHIRNLEPKFRGASQHPSERVLPQCRTKNPNACFFRCNIGFQEAPSIDDRDKGFQ